jgi:hypothetical protein
MSASHLSDTADPQVHEARERYRRLISPDLEEKNLGRLVSLDTDSDEFEIGDDLVEMAHRLKARRPNARVFSFRIGGGGGPVDRFGSPRRVLFQ